MKPSRKAIDAAFFTAIAVVAAAWAYWATRFTETAGLLGESGHGIVHALQQNRSSIAPLIWSAEEIGG